MVPNDTTSQTDLIDHYRRQNPLTDGRLGSLSAAQSTKLQQLWRLLLFQCESEEMIPVQYSLAYPNESRSSNNKETIDSLSFEPLVALNSSKDNGGNGRARATSSEPESNSNGGWFGWASSNSSNQNNSIDDSTAEQKHETVQDYLSRANDGKLLVPPSFTPLLSQPRLERSFRGAFWQAATVCNDPDAWVLRFLRARKWNVDKAFNMIKKTIIWRVGQAIDEIAYFGESMLHYQTLDSGLAFACAKDRLGCPVYVIRVRANVARYRSLMSIKRFLCWQIETSQLLSGGSDGRATIFFDFTGFAMENIDTKLVRTLITLLANYYPETLGIMVIYANSWWFSSLWAAIAPFIDPVVKSKIIMAKTPQDIAPYIDLDDLMEELGGRKEFEYRYVPPTASENSCMSNREARKAAEEKFAEMAAKCQDQTKKWVSGDSEYDEEERNLTKQNLYDSVVALDPYIRARTLYHRLGLIFS